jgi:hypothetical protein
MRRQMTTLTDGHYSRNMPKVWSRENGASTFRVWVMEGTEMELSFTEEVASKLGLKEKQQLEFKKIIDILLHAFTQALFN